MVITKAAVTAFSIIEIWDVAPQRLCTEYVFVWNVEQATLEDMKESLLSTPHTEKFSMETLNEFVLGPKWVH